MPECTFSYKLLLIVNLSTTHKKEIIWNVGFPKCFLSCIVQWLIFADRSVCQPLTSRKVNNTHQLKAINNDTDLLKLVKVSYTNENKKKHCNTVISMKCMKRLKQPKIEKRKALSENLSDNIWLKNDITIRKKSISNPNLSSWTQ